MRDIRGDLQDRANMVEQQISAENAQFEQLILQLKAEQDSRVEHLRAQLQLVNKLLEFAAWQHNVRSALVRAIKVTEVAEDRSNETARASLVNDPRSTPRIAVVSAAVAVRAAGKPGSRIGGQIAKSLHNPTNSKAD
jgi:hypothetical protein